MLRDEILHLLAEDHTLEPRDVIVMCPDIETFAPLIQATFGAGDVVDDESSATPRRCADLRVRLADRSLRQTNPVLGVVAQLLDLGSGRLTASEVLDLADREPVRRRFRFDDEDLERIRDWVATAASAGASTPTTAPRTSSPDLDAGTWNAGLDRVLVGVTMTEEDHRLFGGVLPLDDVECGVIDLAGRLAESSTACRRRSTRSPPPADRRVGPGARHRRRRPHRHRPRDAWQRAQLERILGDVVSEAAGAATAR